MYHFIIIKGINLLHYNYSRRFYFFLTINIYTTLKIMFKCEIYYNNICSNEVFCIFQDAGANCVKFQKTCLKERFTKKYLERPYDNPNSWGKTYGEHKSRLEFNESQFRELLRYANEVGIPLAASAMDMVRLFTTFIVHMYLLSA